MTGVLVLPPAVAETDARVADESSHELGRLPQPEDLTMRHVVHHECDLRERHGHERRDQQRPPRIADEDERRPPADERDPDEAEPHGVVDRTSAHQPRLGDSAQQAGVITLRSAPR